MKYLFNQENIGTTFFNIEELSNHYYILNDVEDNNLNSNGIIKSGIKGRDDIKHHIIICGMINEIINLILPLRAKYIPEKLLKWVVILANYLPNDIHETLRNFQKIIFIQGDPLNPENFHKVNISSADIAVILSQKNIDFNSFEKQENIVKNEEEINENKNNDDFEKNNNEEERDAKILFIYKAIKKINSSIKIITELSNIKNIEFLQNEKEFKKINKYSKLEKKYKNKNKNEDNEVINDNESNENENVTYEFSPINASGEIFLPSLIDKITGQIYHKEYLYNILNLLITGEKVTHKSSEQKLSKLFNNLANSYLFLIPCESRNESFGDMFNRLLLKNKMISIALYRKNDKDNFYYVYTNPKKTTLIRETDMVFVLSSTENIIAIYEKNLVEINPQQKYYNELFSDDKNYENNYDNNINNNNNNSNFFKALQDAVQQQLKDTVNNNNNINNKKKENNSNKGNSEFKNAIFSNLFKDKKGKDKRNSIRKGDEKDIYFQKGKYTEIDTMQNRLDKAMEKLKLINIKCKDIKNDVDDFVKEEIVNELSVYVSKTVKK